MCLLAILYRSVPEAPLLVAANREEFFDRPYELPTITPGPVRYLAGRDLRAGGTWLGVNEFGLVAAVTNRPLDHPPAEPRSRGQLCREMLLCRGADEAADLAARELKSERYAGANFIAADNRAAFLIEHGGEVALTPLAPGLHLVTNGRPNDPSDPRQSLARELFSAVGIRTTGEFLDVARSVCRQGPDPATGRTILIRLPERGTVSSTLIALPNDRAQTIYEFAAGPPDVTPYRDYSGLMRELLAQDRTRA
ncbi:MAG TPA: NRDE family protein [Pirellulales bacterium]|jgi:uncharacterized protein with NRDE domain